MAKMIMICQLTENFIGVPVFPTPADDNPEKIESSQKVNNLTAQDLCNQRSPCVNANENLCYGG